MIYIHKNFFVAIYIFKSDFETTGTLTLSHTCRYVAEYLNLLMTHSHTVHTIGLHSHTLSVHTIGLHSHTLLVHTIGLHSHTLLVHTIGLHSHTLLVHTIGLHSHTLLVHTIGLHSHTLLVHTIDLHSQIFLYLQIVRFKTGRKSQIYISCLNTEVNGVL